MRLTHILWDWNGTLLDDVAASLAVTRDMLTARGLDPISLERYHELLDIPIIRFYEKAFDLTREGFDGLLAEYNAGYLRQNARMRVASGAIRALEAFRVAGCRQAVVSSSEQATLDAHTRAFGLSPYFAAILGAPDNRAESKIERARAWLEAESADPRQALVIGDLRHDYELAAALGARCALVAGGHNAKRDLCRCGVPVYDDLTGLLACLEEGSL